MTAFDSKSSKDANDAQKKKYPDMSAEMRRRAAMRKTFGTGGFRYLKANDPEKFAQIIADREKKRVDKHHTDGRTPADE